MGCTQSKIENEEAVTRCKSRRQFMKEAVSARNAFAAAHSGYAMYLKNTGAALSDFGQGEVQNPLVVQTQSNSTAPQAPMENLRPPPPPTVNFDPPVMQIQRAASMPQIIPKPETVKSKPKRIDEDEDEDDEIANEGSLRRRSRSSKGGHKEVAVEDMDAPPPLPSSPTRTPPRPPPLQEVRTRGPPSPPPLQEVRTRGPPSPPPLQEVRTRGPPSPPPPQVSTWDFFFNVDNIPGPTLDDVEEVRINKEEIERKVFDERPTKVVVAKERQRRVEAEELVMPEKPVEPPVEAEAEAVVEKKSLKKVKMGGSTSGEGKRGKNNNLLQIFVDLDDHFLKASESAHEVSKMLEATRLHYHSNFADNRGHIDHSARVMRVITWNRSFKGMPNVDAGKDDFDSEEHETHATVLDKLLAWEKKLYDEVKAGELMKIEYQKKVSSLNKLKKRGGNSDALEKAKAAVSHLHTRYIVDMQSLDSTVSEINRLRDDQLYPKLVQLVDGMATMWKTMQFHHEHQLSVLQDLKYLDISQSPKETSEHHHERTIQLFVVVQEWHSQFQKLINNQKEYIKALNSWLKLNLTPIESSLKEKVSSPPRIHSPPIQGLLGVWHDHLGKLPDEPARSAIYNFAAVIETIMHQQEEEMKLKYKCEETKKELARKTRQFEDWYNKYMQRRIPDEEVDPERTADTGSSDGFAERQFMVETVKKRLEHEQEAYQTQSKHVREKSVASLKMRMPELFKALTEFAAECSEMYDEMRSLPQNINDASA